jgi:hypothetical protein
VATNSSGTAYGSDMSFTTASCPAAPTATTGAASAVTATGANLGATVSDGGAATTVTFEYGMTASYGNAASGGTVNAGAGSTAVSASVLGFACGTLYHFRVKAVNISGTSYGIDAGFTTSPCLVSVNGAGFVTLQSGYNADSGQNEVKLLAGASVGSLVVNVGTTKGTVLIKGGYDADFSTGGGNASIVGATTLSAGTTKFQNVIVK